MEANCYILCACYFYFYNAADIFLGGINPVDQLEARGEKNSYVNQANKRGVVFFG